MTTQGQGTTPRFTVFSLIGLGWVIAGGLLAAVTGPLDLDFGSWAAAYLVLVLGVAQGVLGTAQDLLTAARSSRGVLVAELAGWNLGSIAVLAGTLTRLPLVVDAGGLVLVATLVLMAGTVRRGGAGTGPGWVRWVFWTMVVVLLVSIPVGLVLAHLRA